MSHLKMFQRCSQSTLCLWMLFLNKHRLEILKPVQFSYIYSYIYSYRVISFLNDILTFHQTDLMKCKDGLISADLKKHDPKHNLPFFLCFRKNIFFLRFWRDVHFSHNYRLKWDLNHCKGQQTHKQTDHSLREHWKYSNILRFSVIM